MADSQVEEIKSKLDIVEVVRDYVPNLKAVGTNFTALSPFQREKRPSFVVSPDKQIWHCFSSGKGGDIFKFVMEMENINFVEALRLLAKKAGVELKSYRPQEISQRNRLLDLLQAAVDKFHRNLMETPAGEAARAYLLQRGLTEETWQKWQIGFALDAWEDLTGWLAGRGFKAEEMFAAGMASRQPGRVAVYDRFRNRIMFPLRDANGATIGFTGRVLPGGDETMGKYVNTPATLVYDKSKVLFGLDQAKMVIKQQGYVILMEGQLDVIAAHQFGFKNTVGASGTALTPEQVKLLGRYTDNIILCLDADAAGQKATDKAENVVRSVDLRVVEAKDKFGTVRKYIDPDFSFRKNLKVIVMPPGLDPDQFIRQDREGFIRALKTSKSVMQYYFDKTLNHLDLTLVEHKKHAAKILLPLIARQQDSVEKDFWLKKLAGGLEVEPKFLYEAMMTAAPKNLAAVNQPTDKLVDLPIQSREEILSERLLAVLLKFPKFLRYILDILQPEQLVGENLRVFYKQLVLYYNERAGQLDFDQDSFILDYQKFTDFLERQGFVEQELKDKLFILADRDFYQHNPEQANLEIRQMAKELQRYYLNRRLKATVKLIAEAEKGETEDDNSQTLQSLLAEFNNLTRELGRLEQ